MNTHNKSSEKIVQVLMSVLYSKSQNLQSIKICLLDKIQLKLPLLNCYWNFQISLEAKAQVDTELCMFDSCTRCEVDASLTK